MKYRTPPFISLHKQSLALCWGERGCSLHGTTDVFQGTAAGVFPASFSLKLFGITYHISLPEEQQLWPKACWESTQLSVPQFTLMAVPLENLRGASQAAGVLLSTFITDCESVYVTVPGESRSVSEEGDLPPESFVSSGFMHRTAQSRLRNASRGLSVQLQGKSTF